MESERDVAMQERKGAQRTHQRTSPSEDSKPWVYIPHEIIVEILYRLPVKTLLQFRCVCKSWRSLISDPQFVKTHLNISTSKQDYAHYRIILSSVRPHFNLKSCSLHSALYQPSVDAVELDYPMKNPHNSVWIVGSCNGLICIAIEEYDIFIWNPSTRKSKRLPNSGMRMRYGCFMIYGFGYDDSTDDYKVVGIYCVVGNVGSYETEVKIYTLRTDSWRRIQDFPCGIPLDDSGKYANGALHWAASSDAGSSYSWVIVSFDLAKETYGEVAQPNYGGNVSDFSLGVLGGCLCVVCTYLGTHVDVWVMKEYNVKDSWTKLITIPYSTGRPQYPMPLCISKNDEILTESGSSLVIYNSTNNISRCPLIHHFQACLEVDTYIESLVSPIAETGVERQC